MKSSDQRPAVVVTGVSSGIGRGIADVLAARGYHVFGSVRSEADSARVSAAMAPGTFTPLLFDVTDEEAVAAAFRVVDAALDGRTLTGLVNSAGIALAGPLLHQDTEDFAKHFAINVTGPFIVTKAFAPLLGSDRARVGPPGRIVLVSSISGRLATPFLGGYAASKHAIEGFADTLRRELMLFGIDVVVIAPGAVATPIWDKAQVAGVPTYADTPYAAAVARFRNYMIANGRKGLPPEHIGAGVANALTIKNPAAHQAVLKGKFGGWTVPTLLPKRTLDRILARSLGLLPR